MNAIRKRAISLVLLLCVSLGATIAYMQATAIQYKPFPTDAETVLTVNGSPVGADEYASYMLYNMKYYENMYAQYGMTDIWSDEESAQMIGAGMPEAAKQQAIYMRVVLEKFKEEHLRLSAQKQQELKEQIAQMKEAVGGEENYLTLLSSYGFNDQMYRNFLYVAACFDTLNDTYFGEKGTMGASHEELMQYFNEHYLSAKHVLIKTIDENGNALTGDALKEKQALAAEVAKRAQAGEDFDALIKEYGEDPGMDTYPNGYIFTEGEMVDEFYQAVKALEVGAISDPVESNYGLHIILRQPLTEEDLSDHRDVLNAQLGKTMEMLLNQWMTEAQVEVTDLFDTIAYDNAADYALVHPQSMVQKMLGQAQGDDAQDAPSDAQDASDAAQ